MELLEVFLSERGERSIHALASYIEQYCLEEWQPVLRKNQEVLRCAFAEVGEGAAYGAYALRLFRPVRLQLHRAGFHSRPGFPGTLATSREWGQLAERQRWMWCVVSGEHDQPAGALVIQFFHDHTRFRIPRSPGVLARPETETDTIIAALSRASADFARADA